MTADTLILSAYTNIYRNDKNGIVFKKQKFPNVLVARYILMEQVGGCRIKL